MRLEGRDTNNIVTSNVKRGCTILLFYAYDLVKKTRCVIRVLCLVCIYAYIKRTMLLKLVIILLPYEVDSFFTVLLWLFYSRITLFIKVITRIMIIIIL